MSKKAKSEVTDNSADTVMDGVLSENQAKLNKLNSSIQAAYERRRKIITDSKLYTYDKLSQLYGGAEGQALLDECPTLTLRGWSIAPTMQTASWTIALPMMNLSGRLLSSEIIPTRINIFPTTKR